MPIIHYFSDREQKKLNIKIISAILIVVGVILTTYFIATTLHPKQIVKEEPKEIKEEKKVLCLDKSVGIEFGDKVEKYLKDNKVEDIASFDSETCHSKIVRNPIDINPYTLSSTTLYVPVVSVLSNLNEISKDQLISSLNSQKYKTFSLLWNKNTDDFLRSRYSFGVGQTTYISSEIEKKLSQSPTYIAIIPFDDVKPKYKILKVDGQDILNENISLLTYPLSDTFWFKTDNEHKEELTKLISSVAPKNNFDRTKLTKIYLTGSSLVGSDAYNVNILTGKKVDYMIENIKSLIPKKDILHISNEVSIYTNCIQKIQSSYLCSKEKDFQPLQTLGVDVVGVTGNHIMDFGYDTFADTLDWYTQNKMKFFGAGNNEEQSHTPAVISMNGVKIAFLGYNFIPPYSYYSSGNRGGSANVSLKMMRRDIEKAKKISDILVVDMNWGDELQTKVDSTQIEYGKAAVEYGADIVNGVNSYSTLGIDSYLNSNIFYGLGGFLNPQAKSGMLSVQYLYGKKYISYDLIPIAYEKDYTLTIPQSKIKDGLISDIYKQSRIIYDEK